MSFGGQQGSPADPQCSQVPAAHNSDDEHALPQAPQLAGSFWKAAGRVQTPWQQTRPSGQTVAQAPQLLRSSVRITHLPRQLVKPSEQRPCGLSPWLGEVAAVGDTRVTATVPTRPPM